MSKFIMSFDVISSNRKQIKLTGDSNLIFIINNPSKEMYLKAKENNVIAVVIDEMILLDSPKGDRPEGGYESRYTADESASPLADVTPAEEVFNPENEDSSNTKKSKKEEVKEDSDEIPF